MPQLSFLTCSFQRCVFSYFCVRGEGGLRPVECTVRICCSEPSIPRRRHSATFLERTSAESPSRCSSPRHALSPRNYMYRWVCIRGGLSGTTTSICAVFVRWGFIDMAPWRSFLVLRSATMQARQNHNIDIEATEFIHSWISREQPVLVHCRAGVSRSASIAIA